MVHSDIREQREYPQWRQKRSSTTKCWRCTNAQDGPRAYWPHRFHRKVGRIGGLPYARELLRPGDPTSGFDRLASSHRADLSVEAIATSSRFANLFTAGERAEALRRLALLPDDAFPADASRPIPEEIPSGPNYREGAVRRIYVNRYERDARARRACIRHQGTRCVVCGFSFEERYGELGRDFIHVHHLRPLAGRGATKRVDPKRDLIPVCPNCHAMLHRKEPPLDVDELRQEVSLRRRRALGGGVHGHE